MQIDGDVAGRHGHDREHLEQQPTDDDVDLADHVEARHQVGPAVADEEPDVLADLRLQRRGAHLRPGVELHVAAGLVEPADALARPGQGGVEGVAAQGAGDGEDGLFKAMGVSYDAVVLDVMLPQLDGWEVLRRLRATSIIQIPNCAATRSWV